MLRGDTLTGQDPRCEERVSGPLIPGYTETSDWPSTDTPRSSLPGRAPAVDVGVLLTPPQAAKVLLPYGTTELAELAES